MVCPVTFFEIIIVFPAYYYPEASMAEEGHAIFARLQ
jgi:hypothetical protein